MSVSDDPYVVSLADVDLNDIPRVGGKNAALGQMIRELSSEGIRIPGGFAITVAAYRAFLKNAGILTGKEIAQCTKWAFEATFIK